LPLLKFQPSYISVDNVVVVSAKCNKELYYIYLVGRDSSVGVATRYGLDTPWI